LSASNTCATGWLLQKVIEEGSFKFSDK